MTLYVDNGGGEGTAYVMGILGNGKFRDGVLAKVEGTQVRKEGGDTEEYAFAVLS